MIIPKVFRNETCSVLVGCLFILCCSNVSLAEEPSLLNQPVLRQRIAVLAVPSSGATEAEQSNITVLQSETWRALLLHEGITISPDEWATAIDLTKAAIGESETLLLASPPGATLSRDSISDFVLLARYGTGLNGHSAFFRLVEAESGLLLQSSDAAAASMKNAVDNALAKIEVSVALLPWRCRVIGVNEDTMVIDRGRLDGVRVGQQFIGYSMVEEGRQAGNVPIEQRLMQYGTRTGLYRVVEEGQAFSKLQPVEEAPLLKAGDILELPGIRVRDRSRRSRGRSLWEHIYKEQK